MTIENPWGDDKVGKGSPPSARFLRWFHREVDTKKEDEHHRIGFGPDDAAAGDHTHNGVDSAALFDASQLPAVLAPTATLPQTIDAFNALRAVIATKAGGV